MNKLLSLLRSNARNPAPANRGAIIEAARTLGLELKYDPSVDSFVGLEKMSGKLALAYISTVPPQHFINLVVEV